MKGKKKEKGGALNWEVKETSRQRWRVSRPSHL